MATYFDGDTFERNGRTFRVSLPQDDSPTSPWEDDDGVGIVSDWTRRAKSSGEREMCNEHGARRFYDFAASMIKAKKDGWGLAPDDIAALECKLGRKPTWKRVIAEAVERDFDRLRRWCADQWCYVCVVVEALDDEGDPMGECDSLGGIESDSGEYIAEVAHEMADEIGARLDETFAADVQTSRPDMQGR